MKKASLAELFLSFAKIGLFTFGGGYAMLPMLERECVVRHGWASQEDMLNYYAIGQCTPGIIAVNTASFIGFKVRGTLGAVVATLGVVFPSFVIISLLAYALDALKDNMYFIKAVQGIRVAVCALIANSILRMSKNNIKTCTAFLLAVLAFALITFAGFSPVAVVFIAAGIGIVSHFIAGGKIPGGEGDGK